MVKRVLTLAGFVDGETFKEVRFLTPPRVTYAVYLDAYEAYGSDDRNLIKAHSYSIELYSYVPDKEAEKRLENALDELGIAYEKQSRYWLESEQLYQVIYDFDHIEK